MKQGALDFLAKPVDPDHLLLMVERALAQRRMLGEYQLLKEEAAARRGGGDRHIRRRCGRRWAPSKRPRAPTPPCCSKARAAPARNCARGPCTAAARGPTGRLWPSTAPRFPRRCSRPSCSATSAAPSPAPTPASSASSRLAQRGTIFLDEIGEMPIGVQAKMLRAIETKRIERLGGGGSFQVDVRIVAATNRKLAAGGGGAAVPRGPVLPPVGVSDHGAAAARSQGGHSAARDALRGSRVPRRRQAAHRLGGGDCGSWWRIPGPATSASCRT